MCIKSSSKCPVTDLQIIGQSDASTAGYKYIPFTKDYKIGFSSTVDSMPVTLTTLQENKPCQFYAYSSLASINGKDRFYLTEYKPIMKSYKLWANPGR